MKVRSIFSLFKFLKFMTKSILSLGTEKQYLHKVSFENMLSTYMFSPDASLPQVFVIMKR